MGQIHSNCAPLQTSAQKWKIEKLKEPEKRPPALSHHKGDCKGSCSPPVAQTGGRTAMLMTQATKPACVDATIPQREFQTFSPEACRPGPPTCGHSMERRLRSGRNGVLGRVAGWMRTHSQFEGQRRTRSETEPTANAGPNPVNLRRAHLSRALPGAEACGGACTIL